jgi:hypothetical protein
MDLVPARPRPPGIRSPSDDAHYHDLVSADADPVDALRGLEQELCRIPDVTAARVVSDGLGRPVEVHILASPAKHAKQIVRDVQSVAIASFGLELDRRIISVVQLQLAPGDLHESERVEAGPEHRVAPAAEHPSAVPSAGRAGRYRVDGVSAATTGTAWTAQVILRRGEEIVIGAAEGVGVSGAAARLVAKATLSAIGELEAAATHCDVEQAMVVRVGERFVALATVVFAVPPYEEVVTGAAIVRAAGEHDAMARAVLDATNRRVGHVQRR